MVRSSPTPRLEKSAEPTPTRGRAGAEKHLGHNRIVLNPKPCMTKHAMRRIVSSACGELTDDVLLQIVQRHLRLHIRMRAAECLGRIRKNLGVSKSSHALAANCVCVRACTCARCARACLRQADALSLATVYCVSCDVTVGQSVRGLGSARRCSNVAAQACRALSGMLGLSEPPVKRPSACGSTVAYTTQRATGAEHARSRGTAAVNSGERFAPLPELQPHRRAKIIEVDSISEVGVVWCMLYVA